MISAELYRTRRPLVLLGRSRDVNLGAWARLQEAFARGIVGGSPTRTEIRVDVFLAELNVLREIRSRYGEKIEVGDTLKSQLKSLASDRKAREEAITRPRSVATAELGFELIRAGFQRELKPFQLQNLAAILQLPHGADFSVPGAGKTTVALANFTLERARGNIDQLLVIAPIAAFRAWKEDSVACMTPRPSLAVHTGPAGMIPEDLDILLTNYNRVASDYDRIREYVATRPTQVILDEAHRIKRGEDGVHGRAVLDLAYAAKRRDVLTGTPAPQGAYDLIAPVRFLYPGQDQQILPASAYSERDGRNEEVLQATGNAIARYFVRTRKSQLKLPPTSFNVISRSMSPIQRAIYESLIGHYRGEFILERDDRRKLDRLGRVLMYLLEAATNPMLLVAGSDQGDQEEFGHPPFEIQGDERVAELLERYRDYESPWKYEQVKRIIEDEARLGRKVLVWSTFVRNLKSLSAYLKKYSPAVIHGGIPSEDGAPVGVTTREAELDRFRDDPNCTVLLANPAACGEGVSLHLWCHHAVYLDRTFNAGHFLQSQDRIHRLGLPNHVVTDFTVLLSKESIDQAVDDRLREKIEALSRLMNDPGLVQVALPQPDVNVDGESMTSDDMETVVSLLENGS